MAFVVRAYPLRAGMADLRGFGQTLLQAKRAQTDDFFRRHGASHESWHAQQIGNAVWIICCTQLADRVTAEESYGSSKVDFDMWFKDQVKALTGIDPNETPLGMPSEQVFCWDDPSGAKPVAA